MNFNHFVQIIWNDTQVREFSYRRNCGSPKKKSHYLIHHNDFNIVRWCRNVCQEQEFFFCLTRLSTFQKSNPRVLLIKQRFCLGKTYYFDEIFFKQQNDCKKNSLLSIQYDMQNGYFPSVCVFLFYFLGNFKKLKTTT